MGLKIIRICDCCGKEIEQIGPTALYTGFEDFVCSDCLLSIGQLIDQEAKENEGRGVSCVKSIIHHLNSDGFHTAKVIYRNEGDKIRSYPRLQNILYNLFGCRNHFDKHCKDNICVALKGYNDRDLQRLPE